MIDPDKLAELEAALADADRFETQPSVDLAVVSNRAWQAAAELAHHNATRVVIEPGDMTRYDVAVARPIGGPWIVSLVNLSQRSHEWHPDNAEWTSAGYVLGHWTDSEWTAQVLSAFLNLLRIHWKAVNA